MLDRKLPGLINRIDLTDATFTNPGTFFEPTLINFIYGSNGSGKSTIARTISSGKGCHLSENPQNYSCYLFDQDFIDKNFQNYHSLEGVFSVDSTNIETLEALEKAQEEKSKIDQQIKEKIGEYIDLQASLKNPKEQYKAQCWTRNSDLRTTYKEAFRGYLKSEPFYQMVIKERPLKRHSEMDIKAIYDLAFADQLEPYPMFPVFTDYEILDRENDEQLLKKRIESRANTPFAQFISALNATSWIEQSHSRFHDQTNGICPYCQQALPDNFEEELAACFDDQYQRDCHLLKELRKSYVEKANEMTQVLSAVPNRVPDNVDTSIYYRLKADLDKTIRENIDQLDRKISDPSTSISLLKIADIIKQISEQVKVYNSVINEINSTINQKTKKQSECSRMLWELISFLEHDFIAAYKEEELQIQNKLSVLKKEGDELRGKQKDIEAQIRNLQNSSVNTIGAINNMNMLLKNSCYQGFMLRPKEGVQNTYEVIRPNGQIANSVSEGEKNFIAFLYFYHLVKDEISVQSGKIVVIDDPISSLDNSAMFLVTNLCKDLIDICENNSGMVAPNGKGDFITQLFVLTHNTYFHNALTHDYIDKFRYVSFFKVEKHNNISQIRISCKFNPSKPTDLMNENPVIDPYTLLWKEYSEAKDPHTLMNAMRRILDAYFIQNCGFKGADLVSQCISQNEDKFIQKNADGSNNYDGLIQAKTMLSYLQTGPLGFFDTVHYVDDGVDIKESKKSFEKIFTLMNHSQHYESMMRRVAPLE